MSTKRGADAPTTDGESDGTTLADRRTFIKGVGATAATLATAGAASAQETTTADGPEWTTGRDGLAWSSDYVQDPYIAEGALTRARHRMVWCRFSRRRGACWDRQGRGGPRVSV